jgi:hypothetical protein
LFDRNFADVLSDAPGGLVPTDPAKQDDMTGVIVGYNFARELVGYVKVWVLRTHVTIKLNKRVQISILLQLREVGIILIRQRSAYLLRRIGADDYDRSDLKRKMCFNVWLLSMEPLATIGIGALGIGPAPSASIDLSGIDEVRPLSDRSVQKEASVGANPFTGGVLGLSSDSHELSVTPGTLRPQN